MNNTTHDYIVVGGGSAGCVLAARLSENGRHSVLLLEAGPPDSNPWIQVPLGVTQLFAHPTLNWRFETEAVASLKGRQLYQPRGKMLGGTGSLNGMVYARGNPADYDHWRDLGCEGWDWASVLPYFIKSENQARGASALHGVNGPLTVSDAPESEIGRAFVQAAIGAGIPFNPDFNGAQQDGVGRYQITATPSRRVSTARAFLDPARKRPNLTVVTGAHATRVLFEGTRATGVEYRAPEGIKVARATKEVILAGGVFGSPQLLQLSGIGSASVLGALGIAVTHDLPAVGRNLHDHFNVHLSFRCNKPITLNDLPPSPLRKLGAGIAYGLWRGGPLATTGNAYGAFVRSSPEQRWPDLQLNCLLFSSKRRTAEGPEPHPFSAFTLSLVHLRSQSRGDVTLASRDPMAAPAIRMNFLGTDDERAAMLAGVKLCRRIAASKPLSDYVVEEVLPGRQVQDDAAWMDDIRTRGIANYHPVGTCRMGNDADTVVDHRLRVRGVIGLRVADSSVMPQITAGNTNAPTIMIAEKAADMVLADAGRPM